MLKGRRAAEAPRPARRRMATELQGGAPQRGREHSAGLVAGLLPLSLPLQAVIDVNLSGVFYASQVG